MASGRLGKAAIPQNADTTVYTVPADKLATVTINLCNIGADVAVVRVGVSTVAAPAAADWIEYDVSIPGNGTLERTGVVCSAGERVVVKSSTATVTARVHGFEGAA